MLPSQQKKQYKDSSMFRYLSSYLPFILISLFIYGYIFLKNQEVTIIEPPLINSGKQAIQVDFLESTEPEITKTDSLSDENSEIEAAVKEQATSVQEAVIEEVVKQEAPEIATDNEIVEANARPHKIKIIPKNSKNSYKSDAYHLATSENKPVETKPAPTIEKQKQALTKPSESEVIITESIETEKINVDTSLQPEVKEAVQESNSELAITVEEKVTPPQEALQVQELASEKKIEKAKQETTPKAPIEKVKQETTPEVPVEKVKQETTPKAPVEKVKQEATPEAPVEKVKQETTPEVSVEKVKQETIPEEKETSKPVTESNNQTPEEIKIANEKLHKSIQDTPAIIDATLKGDIFNENVKLQAIQAPKSNKTNPAKNKTKNKEVPKPVENSNKKKKTVFKKEVNSEAVEASNDSQGAVQEAIVVSGNKPTYPQRAILRNKEGRVVVSLTVTSKGKPKNAKITTSSGHEILDETVLEFVNQELFMPALQGQDKVSSEQVFSFRFELK